MIGFWGLAIPEMAHRFHAEGGKPMYAWCALDPFLVVPVIGRRARVESSDPVTGEPIVMTVTPAGAHGVRPKTAVLSFLVPSKPFDHEVIQSFCHYVLAFASDASARSWVAEHPGTMVVSVAEAADLGRMAWHTFIREPAHAGA